MEFKAKLQLKKSNIDADEIDATEIPSEDVLHAFIGEASTTAPTVFLKAGAKDGQTIPFDIPSGVPIRDAITQTLATARKQFAEQSDYDHRAIIVGQPVGLQAELRRDVALAAVYWLRSLEREKIAAAVKSLFTAPDYSFRTQDPDTGKPLKISLMFNKSIEEVSRFLSSTTFCNSDEVMFSGHGAEDGTFLLKDGFVSGADIHAWTLGRCDLTVLFNCCFAEMVTLSFATGSAPEDFKEVQSKIATQLEELGASDKTIKAQIDEVVADIKAIELDDVADASGDSVDARVKPGVPAAKKAGKTNTAKTASPATAVAATNITIVEEHFAPTAVSAAASVSDAETFDAVDRFMATLQNLRLAPTVPDSATCGTSKSTTLLRPLGYRDIPGDGALAFIIRGLFAADPRHQATNIKKLAAEVSDTEDVKSLAADAIRAALPLPELGNGTTPTFAETYTTPDDVTVAAFNVGCADSYFVALPTDDEGSFVYLLIDGGKPAGTKVWFPQVAYGNPLSSLFVTHCDNDHVGGLLSWGENYATARDIDGKTSLNYAAPLKTYFWAPGNKDDRLEEGSETDVKPPSPATTRSLKQAERLWKAFPKTEIPMQGSTIKYGDCTTIYVLNPQVIKTKDGKTVDLVDAAIGEDRVGGHNSITSANLASLVLLIHWKKGATERLLLFNGDAHEKEIIAGLEYWQGSTSDPNPIQGKTWPVTVDLLTIPHHGSTNNTSTELFKKVVAKNYICSSDAGATKAYRNTMGTGKVMYEAMSATEAALGKGHVWAGWTFEKYTPPASGKAKDEADKYIPLLSSEFEASQFHKLTNEPALVVQHWDN